MKSHWFAACILLALMAGCSLLEEKGVPLPTARPGIITVQPKPFAPLTLAPTVTAIATGDDADLALPTALPKTTSTSPVPPTAAGAASSTPVLSAAEGWRTFTSATLQVAVDYPADWSAAEQSGTVVFKSPQGGQVIMGLMDTGNLTPEDFLRANELPNTRCEERTNANGLKAQVCFDTLAKSYSASIAMELPDGAKQLLSLAAKQSGDRRAFDLMLESVRIAP
jgi:hypothetical protein